MSERATPRRSLARRLYVSLGVMLVVLLAVAGFGVASFGSTLGGLEEFRQETVGESARIDLVRELLVRMDDLGEEYVESGDRARGVAFRTGSEGVDAGFRDLAAMDDRPELALVEAARLRWVAAREQIALAAAIGPGPRGDALDPFHDQIDQSGELLADLQRLNVQQVGQEIAALRGRARLDLGFSLVTFVVGGLLALLLARRASKKIIGPLRALEEATRSLGSDDLGHRVDVGGDDELSHVGEAFNLMASKLQASRQALEHQARHDPLTGLANRALFLERLAQAIARSDRRGTPVSVLYLDLDGFKIVNDTLGHEAGDRVLEAVGDRLRRSVRGEDTVARLGGDEFGILLEEDPLTAARAAERLSRLFSRGATTANGLRIGASIGVSTRTDGEALDELLAQADHAMYAAKAEGKGRWEAFRPALGEVVRRIDLLRDELQRAVEGDEFVVRYQPVIDLATERIVGVEALVRWQHPERGLLAPAEFLPEAERSGHVISIDRYVLHRAAAEIRSWQRDVPRAEALALHVNVSARQLRHPGLTASIREALAHSGLRPEHLVLEITETTLVEEPEAAATELRALKELGVRLALDDFGTGFSSLSHLMRFPIDEIKIDRSFVSAVGDDGERPAVVRALVELGARLGLGVVAEGAETVVQVDYLRAIGCERAQGYHFSAPLDAEALREELLAAVPAGAAAPGGHLRRVV